MDKILWFVTVPAMAHQQQKDFMKLCFKSGMGQFNQKPLQDYLVHVVLEPESGLLFEMKTKPKLFDKDLNVAIFDFGGGTFDLTVVEAKKGETPRMLITDFGDVMGGSDMDRAFLEFIEKISKFSQANLSQNEKAVIISGILQEFQTQKHSEFGKTNEEEKETFRINLGPILKYVKKADIQAEL